MCSTTDWLTVMIDSAFLKLSRCVLQTAFLGMFTSPLIRTYIRIVKFKSITVDSVTLMSEHRPEHHSVLKNV